MARAGKSGWGGPDRIAGAGRWLPVSTLGGGSQAPANSSYVFPEAFLATSKRMHGMNQTEAASFIISDIIPKINYLS